MRTTTRSSRSARAYPAEGWERWLASGEPSWRRIRFAGWSQGGGHAAFLAKDREVAGAIFFGSPQASLNIVAETSTPGFGGTLGQSVPAASASDWITDAIPRTIAAIRDPL